MVLTVLEIWHHEEFGNMRDLENIWLEGYDIKVRPGWRGSRPSVSRTTSPVLTKMSSSNTKSVFELATSLLKNGIKTIFFYLCVFCVSWEIRILFLHLETKTLMHVEFNIIAQNCQKYSFWCISKILFLEKNGAWDFSKHFVCKPYLWYKSGWILKDNTARPLIHELLRSLIIFFFKWLNHEKEQELKWANIYYCQIHIIVE